MTTKSLLAAGLALFAGAAMADRPASFADSRGYQNCVKAAEREADILRVESRYYIDESQQAGARLYYLNASARSFSSDGADGRADSIRIACQTSGSGHRVLAMNVDGGRYTARLSTTADIVSN